MWLTNWAATQDNSNAVLLDANQNKYEFAAHHFQQTLYIEEVATSFSGVELPSNFNLNSVFPNLIHSSSSITYFIEHPTNSRFVLFDGKQKILEQLFPFHFFF